MPGILKKSDLQRPSAAPAELPNSPATPDVPPATASLKFIRVIERAERQLQQAREAWSERWEHEAVRLACRIAARCLRQTDFDSAELAQRLVEESLRGIRLDGGCEVRLNPDDYQQLLAAGQWAGEDVTVLPDSEIEPGGCIVRTADGTIDQTLSAQIRRMEEELTRI